MTKKIIEILKEGGICVLLTDTLFGLVGQAMNKEAVAKIYRIKGRNRKKPLIILISSVESLSMFGIKINNIVKRKLQSFWPGPVSIILPCQTKKFEYLHRGTRTLAFRLPKKKALINIIEKTGPLVAPSANPEKMTPAQNIGEARKYFGKNVDFYLKGPKPKNKPSTIIQFSGKRTRVIR